MDKTNLPPGPYKLRANELIASICDSDGAVCASRLGPTETEVALLQFLVTAANAHEALVDGFKALWSLCGDDQSDDVRDEMAAAHAALAALALAEGVE